MRPVAMITEEPKHDAEAVCPSQRKQCVGGDAFVRTVAIKSVIKHVGTVLLREAKQVEACLTINGQVILGRNPPASILTFFAVNRQVRNVSTTGDDTILEPYWEVRLPAGKNPAIGILRVTADRTLSIAGRAFEGTTFLLAEATLAGHDVGVSPAAGLIRAEAHLPHIATIKKTFDAMLGAAGRREDSFQSNVEEIVVVHTVVLERQLEDTVARNGIGVTRRCGKHFRGHRTVGTRGHHQGRNEDGSGQPQD